MKIPANDLEELPLDKCTEKFVSLKLGEVKFVDSQVCAVSPIKFSDTCQGKLN